MCLGCWPGPCCAPLASLLSPCTFLTHCWSWQGGAPQHRAPGGAGRELGHAALWSEPSSEGCVPPEEQGMIVEASGVVPGLSLHSPCIPLSSVCSARGSRARSSPPIPGCHQRPHPAFTCRQGLLVGQSRICNAFYPPGNVSACCHRAGRRHGDVLEAEPLSAAMPKGRRVWGCPAHSGSGVGVGAGRVPAGPGRAAQPCCSGFPRCVLLLGTS